MTLLASQFLRLRHQAKHRVYYIILYYTIIQSLLPYHTVKLPPFPLPVPVPVHSPSPREEGVAVSLAAHRVCTAVSFPTPTERVFIHQSDCSALESLEDSLRFFTGDYLAAKL